MTEIVPAFAAIEMPPEEGAARGLFGWVATLDHKRVGILYLLTALVFFAAGGVEALLMRIQLARPNNTFLSPDVYDQMFTMHGTTMIFLVVMPTLIGLANYLVPLMIGARDMAFPRLNALSYWLLPCGGFLLHFSLLAGGAPAVGWFSYAPLSEAPYATTAGMDYWAMSLLVLGVGSVAASINLIATILTLRAPGLTMRRLPLYVWMIFVNSFLVIMALPVLNAAIVMLFIDRRLGTHYFAPSHGGSALLWQHFFWAFGHPEVYIMALPAFGIISEVVPVFARRPIFGYEFVAASTVAIALLSFGVWAHHMFAVGLGHPVDLFFSAASMLIAVPTGIKVFAWSATMWGGSIRLTTSMLFAVAFLIQFTIGGLSGVTFAVVPIDWQVAHTYYLVAHFHYVLFGGSLFAVFAGLYYWFPKMTGRMLSERLGRLNFWTAVIGFNTAFFVQHFLGLMGMSRRIYTYPNLPGWGLLNLISTLGAFVLGASVLVLLWNIVLSLHGGQRAGDNPWRAWTLEWATTSPPLAHNFDRVPPMLSRRPLWDLAHPENPDPPVGSPSSGDEFTLEKNRVAMVSFLISEGVFFLILILAYLFYNAHSTGGPSPAGMLNPRRTGLYTFCLLASSLTIWLAEKRLKANKHSTFRGLLALTIVLGIVFLFGQGREYLRIFRSGIAVNSNLFATTFFTLTGFHGLHVCVGVTALLIIMGLALAGDFKEGRIEAVKSIGLYWHFVDVVWLAVFSVVYLRLLL
jgi:cytochrome c oxidase subunit 1/cytochrome c oxidase subunit I+III